MTLQQAYDRLCERWPEQPFCISLNVWHYDTTRPADACRVEWQIWDANHRVHHTGPSLEAAMELALGCDADLAALEAQIKDLAP